MLNEITDPTLGEPVHGHINNQFYSASTGMAPRTTQIEALKVNSIEEWDIVNTNGDAHPIHIHLTQFRLLNRQAFNEPAYTAAVNTKLPAPGLPDPFVSGSGPWPAQSAGAYLLGSPTAPAANEQGWKDTIIAPPGQVTRILIPFGGDRCRRTGAVRRRREDGPRAAIHRHVRLPPSTSSSTRTTT